MNKSRVAPKLAAVAASVAVALGAAACSSPGAHNKPHSKAHLVSRHVQPVGTVSGSFVMEGGAYPHTGARPIPGVVVLQREGGRAVEIQVGKNGRFISSVPVGTYDVSGRTPRITGPGGVEATCTLYKPVVVTPKHTTSVTLACIVP